MDICGGNFYCCFLSYSEQSIMNFWWNLLRFSLIQTFLIKTDIRIIINIVFCIQLKVRESHGWAVLTFFYYVLLIILKIIKSISETVSIWIMGFKDKKSAKVLEPRSFRKIVVLIYDIFWGSNSLNPWVLYPFWILYWHFFGIL